MSILLKAIASCDECGNKADITLEAREDWTKIRIGDVTDDVERIIMNITEAPEGWRISMRGTARCSACCEKDRVAAQKVYNSVRANKLRNRFRYYRKQYNTENEGDKIKSFMFGMLYDAVGWTKDITESQLNSVEKLSKRVSKNTVSFEDVRASLTKEGLNVAPQPRIAR